eukprot:EG_transcript_5516
MGAALCGALLGIVLFIGSLVLIFWNEGRFVKTVKMLNEAQEMVHVYPDCSTVNSAWNGRLVFVTCDIAPNTIAIDPRFNISGPRPSVVVERRVETVQWRQRAHSNTRKTATGGTTTCTYYDHYVDWFGDYVDTASFFSPGRCCVKVDLTLASTAPCSEDPCTKYVGCANTPPPYPSDYFYPKAVAVGAFTLPRDMAQGTWTMADLVDQTPIGLNATLVLPWFYTSVRPSPLLGDARFKWAASTARTVTLLAQQDGASFTRWASQYDADYGLYLKVEGAATLQSVVAAQQEQNQALLWGLRVAGFLACWFGLQLLTGPVALAPQLVPCVGGLFSEVVGCLLCGVNCVFATAFALLLVSIGWLFYRPIIGVPLLLGFVVLLGGACTLLCLRRRRAPFLRQCNPVVLDPQCGGLTPLGLTPTEGNSPVPPLYPQPSAPPPPQASGYLYPQPPQAYPQPPPPPYYAAPSAPPLYAQPVQPKAL